MRVYVAGSLPALFAFASAATYRPVADGGWGAYLRLVLLVAGSSLVAYGLVRARRPLVRVWPLVALAAVLVSGGSLHVARLIHPVRYGAPLVDVEERFATARLDPKWWVVRVSTPAQIVAGDGLVRLTTPSRVPASLQLLLPPEGRQQVWWLRWPASLWLPTAFDLARVAESLEWESAVTRDGNFFILLDTRVLLLQATPYGLHLTYGIGPDVQGAEVSLPAGQMDGLRRWQVTRDASAIAVQLDGRSIWQARPVGSLGYARFGETRSDEQHGGSLELRHVRYRRWWQP